MTRANDLCGQQHELPIECRLDFYKPDAIVEHEPIFRERSRINLNLDDDNTRKKKGRGGIGE